MPAPHAPRPSRRHQLVAWLLPRLRRSRELVDEATERAAVERSHAGRDRSLPTRAVPRFASRWSVVTEELDGFGSFTVTPRHTAPTRTIYYLHGGGFVSPADPFHVRYATRLAAATGARVVLPDYPLAPEHTWRDSFDVLVGHAARWAAEPGGIVLAGDSAGGGLALAVAQAMRDRGGATATHLLLHAPWVDLTTSTPGTLEATATDPWLFLGKIRAYARWWAGSEADLGRPEVSPVFGSLDGLPPALMLYGTRDTLAPGCRLLVARALESDWDLTAVEEPGLIHVYGLLPGIPEARRALDTAVAFLT